MNAVLLAAEAVSSYPGDDLAAVSLGLAAIALVITAIATVIVTPKAEHHDH